jgi:uncharacterized Zn finger protein (UPF0148 family)
MPYRIKDGEIECDTPEEVRALVGAKTSSNGRTNGRKPKRQNSAAVSDSWKKAKALAKKEGLTVFEARSKLAKAKAK